MPTNNIVDIYRYSDVMLKHIPDDALKRHDETFLYSKKVVKLAIMLTDVLIILKTAELTII